MAKSPMLEMAVKVLEEEGKKLSFHDLWEKVIMEMDIDKEAATKRIARLYSDMTLDKRFVSFPKNEWDLKKRLKLEDTIVDTSDIIIDDDEDMSYTIEDIEIDEELDEELDEDDLEVFDDELLEEEDELLDEEFEDEILEFEELADASEE